MQEKRLRRLVCNLLKEQELDPISVENPVYPGTPDVNYIGGWLELKVKDKWPVRDTTIVRVDVRAEQRVWLRRRWQKGGRVHLLLVVGKNWLLFDGDVAADIVGKVRCDVLFDRAKKIWVGRPDALDFQVALINTCIPERREP